MEYYLYVGTYTKTDSEGIYVLHMNKNGQLSKLGHARHRENPSYLTISPDRRFLYSVSEHEHFASITAYAIDADSGKLSEICKKQYSGADMCYTSMSLDGRFIFAANYSSGSILSIQVNSDGSLGECISNIVHKGSSVHPQRQTSAYAHCILPDPNNKFALSTDLGTDKIHTYLIDSEGQLVEQSIEFNTPAGTGPRHLAFDKSGCKVYLIGELSSQIFAYIYDPDTGKLTQQACKNALLTNYQGSNLGADIHITPNGKFLYSSNRGEDTITCFRITDDNLCPVDSFKVEKTPRNFAITPDGKFIVCANLDSDSVTAYTLDSNTGIIGEMVSKISVPTPSCIKVL